jgi:putative transcriptional regulator
MDNVMPGTIRLRVPEILEERKMKTSDFAKASGLTFNTASSLARGMYDRIGLKTIAKVCDALQIQPGELFEYTPESIEKREP